MLFQNFHQAASHGLRQIKDSLLLVTDPRRTQSVKVLVILALCILPLFTGCTDDDDQSPSGQRNVKYELTGNFTGKLFVIYVDNTGSQKTLNNISLPWTLDVAYPANVLSIGIGGQSSTTGSPGQTATLKISIAGNVVKSGTSTAGSLGEMILPTLAHTF